MAHGVAYSTNIKGRCYSFVNDTMNIDNGMLVAMGKVVDSENPEIYSCSIDPTKKAYLVLNPAWNYDDSTYLKKNDESLYTNRAGVAFRVYELEATDRFEVSGDAVTGTLEKDNTVIVGADGKLVKGTAGETGFVGTVIAVRKKGFAYPIGSAGDSEHDYTLDTTNTFYLIKVESNK